ncbi:DUF2917 domain-containing protein [Pyxidicoccus sp. 3LG]
MADWLRTLVERLKHGARRDGIEEAVSLARGDTWSMRAQGGEHLALTCGEGLLWLTREGDARDYVLSPGDTVQLEAAGHVVVQALRPARFCLASAPSDAPRGTRPHGTEAHAR